MAALDFKGGGMTDPTPEPPSPLAQRWLKYLPAVMIGHMLVTVPTFVISLALAYATFVQADATRKIQRSETWPYVSYGTSNISPERETLISFNLSNDGVGPARLKALEFIYDGQPMVSPRSFLQRCCGDDPKNPTPFMSAPVNGVIRPGEAVHFIALPKRPDNVVVYNKLEVERWKVAVRACYCSVFDDCWVMDSRTQDPEPVKACPADWKLFEERPAPKGRRSRQVAH